MKTVFNADAQKFRYIGMGDVAYDAQLRQEIPFLFCSCDTPVVFLHCNQLTVFQNSFEHLRVSTFADKVL